MDVIIVGAGIAGLAAAHELTQAGIKPVVIEARERIGGRIHTIRDHDVPVELGAEFVHGRPPEIFDLAKQFSLNIVPSGGAFIHLPAQDGTAAVTTDPLTGDQAIWEKMEEFAKDSSKDMTLADFLQTEELAISPTARRSFERFVAGFHAAEIDKIGVRSIVDTEEAEDAIGGLASFRIEGGYDRLAGHLYSSSVGRGATFLLNHRITSVKWKRGSVEVEIESDLQEKKIETAAAVIITLPLSILKAEPGSDARVRFDPELGAKHNAVSKLHMGATKRVTLVCRSKWWDEALKELGRSDARLGFLVAEGDVPIAVWWSDASHDTPVLTGWTGGIKARELSGLADSENVDQAVTSLAQIFRLGGRDIESEIISSHTYDWQRDAYSLGSYSYPGVDGKSAMCELAEPLENTLFFAGEATSYQGYWGTVHGAVASGIRAAREVLSID